MAHRLGIWMKKKWKRNNENRVFIFKNVIYSRNDYYVSDFNFISIGGIIVNIIPISLLNDLFLFFSLILQNTACCSLSFVFISPLSTYNLLYTMIKNVFHIRLYNWHVISLLWNEFVVHISCYEVYHKAPLYEREKYQS